MESGSTVLTDPPRCCSPWGPIRNHDVYMPPDSRARSAEIILASAPYRTTVIAGDGRLMLFESYTYNSHFVRQSPDIRNHASTCRVILPASKGLRFRVAHWISSRAHSRINCNWRTSCLRVMHAGYLPGTTTNGGYNCMKGSKSSRENEMKIIQAIS